LVDAGREHFGALSCLAASFNYGDSAPKGLSINN